MKLILTAAVEKLGLAGDVVEVKDGYGRNFLLPQGYAIAWTRGAEKQIEGIKRARDAREVRDAEHAQELRDQLEELSVSITARTSESGQLFGAVTANDVVQAVRKAGGPALDRRSIEFSKPVKNTGEHVVGIKLHDSVNAHLRVEVVAA
ncbi:50S ribosomal protein L9 [Parenemella sanctibonifatiensis]|uniref:Large ribosomal subunit protein bL9 n=1 Tax=Parenemella sanctibonifatiensis TaxID=2016505 RepID=A0A255EF64_9ACTN|nr:50S ribosomal protein L9 [Parenemella sanctibonifatiensis]OYN90187.1 50S ribosomal protein L9 [Parenemella sanctibonifatiensis]